MTKNLEGNKKEREKVQALLQEKKLLVQAINDEADKRLNESGGIKNAEDRSAFKQSIDKALANLSSMALKIVTVNNLKEILEKLQKLSYKIRDKIKSDRE